MRRPGRLLGVGLALAVLGWGLDTQTHVETDITKLVPQNLESLQNLNALERATGVGGEIDLMVSAKDLTKPSTIEWMSAYESAVLEALRLQPHARLRAGAAVPGLLAAGPVPGEEPAATCQRPARSSRRPRCRTCSTRSRRTSPRT